MKKTGMYRLTRGFSILELMVVIAILAIIIALAMMNLSEQLRMKKFKTSCETLLGYIRQAQSEAKAFGRPPQMLDSAGNNNLSFDFDRSAGVPDPEDNHRYVVSLFSNGLGKAMEQKEFQNICITTNFGFDVLDNMDLQNFRGTLLVFTHDSASGPKHQTMLYFGPTGVPGYPEDGNADPRTNYNVAGSALFDGSETDTSYWLGIRNMMPGKPQDLRYVRRIAIDKNQGTAILQRPKRGVTDPDFKKEDDWEIDR